MTIRRLLIVAILAGLPACGQPSTLDLYLKGQLEAEQGHMDSALISLSAAIDRNPKMSLAYMARGDIYKEQGNYEKAAADFERATKLEPYNFNANFELGLMYQYLKRFADAVIAYQRAVDVRPLDSEANMNLALSYTQLGKPFQGLPYAQRAVQGNPESATAQANLGMLYAQIDYDSAAIEALKRSIELNSRQPEVYVNLGQEYIKVSKLDQARNVLETARTLAPSAMVSHWLGVTFYKQKDFDKAIECFNDALKQDPKYTNALNGLGVVAMTRSLQASPPDVALAREALDCWNRSLKIDAAQPKIRDLVNKYTPHE